MKFHLYDEPLVMTIPIQKYIQHEFGIDCSCGSQSSSVLTMSWIQLQNASFQLVKRKVPHKGYKLNSWQPVKPN